MDLPRRSSWAAPSSGPLSAALAAPLSCRLARRALVKRGVEVDGRRRRRRNLRFLAPSALSSPNRDQPVMRDAGDARVDTRGLVEESKEAMDASEKPTNIFTAVAAAALVAASSLSSPFFFSPPPARASAGGDALITFNKRADAAADAVAGALLGALPKGKSVSSSSGSSSSSAEAAAEKEAAAAAALLKEVRDVVALNYLDTRSDSNSGASSSNANGNFDLAAWDAAVEAELTGGEGGGGGGLFFGGAKAKSKGSRTKLRDVPSARRAARRLLAFQLSDPYSRFLSPEEFAAMARYDITGVGLNLGSADEYERKVGERPPGASSGSSSPPSSSFSSASSSSSSSSSSAGRENDSPGVWVIGVVRGSPADAAGVRQGDRVVAVDGTPVDPSKESAFDVASRIQGAGVAEAGEGEESKAASRAATTKGSGSRNSTPLFSSFSLLSSSSSSSKASATRRLSLDVLRRSDGSRSRVELEAPVAPAAVSPVSFELVDVDGGASRAGFIKLDSFNARARSDTAAAVSELLSRGAESFVLDLRGNRGGLVSEGAEVAALFLDKGSTVATTLGRAPLLLVGEDGGGASSSSSASASSPSASASPSSPSASASPSSPSASSSPFASSSNAVTRTTTRTLSTTARPLVPPGTARLTVLVDDRTASAGEIVAGALRDNCRAPLVAVSPGASVPAARRTYGKGLIQSVYELGDGSGLVLTVGKYLTPGMVDLDREGLRPDLEVVAAAGRSSAAAAAAAVGEGPRRAEAEAVLDACLRGRRSGGGGGG